MQHDKRLPLVTLLTMVLICALAVASCDWFASAPAEPVEPATIVDEGSPMRPPVPLGDAQPGGVTHLNNLGLGEGLERDTALTFDGAAQDFYIALDDSADDLLIGLGSTVGTTPGFGLDENLAIATYGDITMGGTTPYLTIGDAGTEDAGIAFDGAAQDFNISLDDTADDLVIGLGTAAGTTDIIVLDESQNVGIGAAATDADFDVTGNGIFDGEADEIQLTVQGYTTQTNNILVVETSGASDLFWVTNNGDVEMNGTTPALTIGDAGEEDAQINFDGAAQDFHVGQYDTDDDLVIGVGTALGTTPAIAVDQSANTTIKKMFNPACTSYSTTGAQTVSPSTSCYLFTNSGTLTLTLGTTGMVAGMLVWLSNTGTSDVVIVDTNIRTTDGNGFTMNQYDTSAWLYTGTEWYLLLNSANQ